MNVVDNKVVQVHAYDMIRMELWKGGLRSGYTCLAGVEVLGYCSLS